jgi:hypothetical protein
LAPASPGELDGDVVGLGMEGAGGVDELAVEALGGHIS